MIPLSDIFFGIVKYLALMIHTLSTCLGDENKEVYNSVLWAVKYNIQMFYFIISSHLQCWE